MAKIDVKLQLESWWLSLQEQLRCANFSKTFDSWDTQQTLVAATMTSIKIFQLVLVSPSTRPLRVTWAKHKWVTDVITAATTVSPGHASHSGRWPWKKKWRSFTVPLKKRKKLEVDSLWKDAICVLHYAAPRGNTIWEHLRCFLFLSTAFLRHRTYVTWLK